MSLQQENRTAEVPQRTLLRHLRTVISEHITTITADWYFARDIPVRDPTRHNESVDSFYRGHLTGLQQAIAPLNRNDIHLAADPDNIYRRQLLVSGLETQIISTRARRDVFEPLNKTANDILFFTGADFEGLSRIPVSAPGDEKAFDLGYATGLKAAEIVIHRAVPDLSHFLSHPSLERIPSISDRDDNRALYARLTASLHPGGGAREITRSAEASVEKEHEIAQSIGFGY